MTGRPKRRHGRRRSSLVSFALMALLVSGCGGSGPNAASDEVRGFLAAVPARAYHVTYLEQTAGHALDVRAVVYDDYGYDVTVHRDGALVVEERSRDDALALRVLRPAAVPGGAAVLRGAGSRWVVDPTGAPDLAALSTGLSVEDPVLSALTALEYLRRAVDSARGVTLFNPEALDYIASKDPFPRPDRASGERRYDVRAPRLPSRGDRLTGAAAPEPSHLRHMSFYVRDGRIVRVLERLSVTDQLVALDDAYGLHLVRDHADEREALVAVNALRRAQGKAPLVLRNLEIRLASAPARPAAGLPSPAVSRGLGPLRHPWRPPPAPSATQSPQEGP